MMALRADDNVAKTPQRAEKPYNLLTLAVEFITLFLNSINLRLYFKYCWEESD